MDPIEALKRISLEDLLLPVLIQLCVIIVAARIFSALFRAIGQPGVVGEIAAGLILGPSLLGAFDATKPIFNAIFHPELHGVATNLTEAAFPKIFLVLSQIGLIFLLFIIGLEFDYSHLRLNGKSAFAVSLTGIALPFALGVGLGWLTHETIKNGIPGMEIPLGGYVLFMGVSMSITAIPILGRIMMELGITKTRIGTVTICSAGLDDAAGWILLASIAAAVKAEFQIVGTLLMLLYTAIFALAMFYIVRPIAIRLVDASLKKHNGQLETTPLALVIAALFVCAILTNLIGIFAIFGAFLFGASMSSHEGFRNAVFAKMKDLTFAFFLPIFFTYTGLRTNVGALNDATSWSIFGGVMFAAVFGKLVGCGLAARLTGFSTKEAAIVGTMMNTRALMELIVINVGRDLNVIPPNVFTMLVLMALITTVMTTPIMLRLMPGTELEPYIRKSGFLKS
jgi:Kef-type K+ transport system membrane component KefB